MMGFASKFLWGTGISSPGPRNATSGGFWGLDVREAGMQHGSGLWDLDVGGARADRLVLYLTVHLPGDRTKRSAERLA